MRQRLDDSLRGIGAALGADILAVELVWRCTACGYQRQATEQPLTCAGCGAGGEHMVGKTSIQWRNLLRHEHPA